MATVAEQVWFKTDGAINICASFLKELEQNGKLCTRGEKTIDEFVDTVNQLILDTSDKKINK